MGLLMQVLASCLSAIPVLYQGFLRNLKHHVFIRLWLPKESSDTNRLLPRE